MKLIIQTKQNSNQSFGVFEFVGKSWLIQTSPFPIHECERDPETLPVDHSLTPRCGGRAPAEEDGPRAPPAARLC